MKLGGENGPFGFNGGFTRIGSKIFDTMLLGLLWLLCALPLVTIGAANTALYYAMVKSVKNDDGYPAEQFFKCFRQNFKQATILWIIYAILIFIAQLNCGILMEKMSGTMGAVLIGFYVAVCVYLILMTLYTFPALSRFSMNTGWFIKLALFMGVRYILTSLVFVIILGCALGLIWRYPIAVFFAPGPVVFLLSEFMESILARHTPQDPSPAEEKQE